MRGSDHGPPDRASPSWEDPDLRSGESRWRARYRLLQSWYRETILGAPPGWYRGSLRGNHLPVEWLARHPHANFLTPEIAEYVETRVPEVLKAGGTLEEMRLRSNLLSSMPLCFNLFGQLRAHPKAAAAPLASVLGLDIAVIDRVEVEWAPEPGRHLNDRTAFDAYIQYRTGDDRRGFVGVETKYTESFSPQVYDGPSYRRVTKSPSSGFRRRAADVLRAPATNQLWRNALLVVSLRQKEGFDEGHVAVLHCAGDHGLTRTMQVFWEQLHEPGELLRAATYEAVIDAMEGVPELADWAAEFRQRYLDLTPVAHVQL